MYIDIQVDGGKVGKSAEGTSARNEMGKQR